MAYLGEILAIIGALCTITLAVLNVLKGRKLKHVDDVESVVKAIGEAVDQVKPVLDPDDARAVTGAIESRARAGGVLGVLDRVLARHGVNAKSRDELKRDANLS